jgi:hypothetical protein
MPKSVRAVAISGVVVEVFECKTAIIGKDRQTYTNVIGC